MIDGKVTDQSKFYTGDSKMVQKFSIGAMVFKDSVSSSESSQVLFEKKNSIELHFVKYIFF